MVKFTRIIAAFVVWALSVVSVVAQQEDKGFLTRTIQEALSGLGREVSIDGFKGALSSKASFDRMTIADKDGVWLTLQDVELVWSRSALLGGRLEVDRLTAEKLEVPRLAVSEKSLPDAEATPFALPDLPISIQIKEFAVKEISLGAPLFGEAARLSIQARASYTEDNLDVELQAHRIDGKTGEFALKTNLARSDNVLDLLLKLNEGPKGIAARLLNLPGQPSIDMSVDGSGPLNDFASDVVVATDGQERLVGKITLGEQSAGRNADVPDRRILADIGGDITALLAPRCRAFFGNDVRLNVDAVIEGTGAINVRSFSLAAAAAKLAGKLKLDAEKWPTLIDVTGLITNSDGTPIQLPVSGPATTVEKVNLRIDYDAAAGENLDADFDIRSLNTDGVEIQQTTLSLGGSLVPSSGTVGHFSGDVAFAAVGLGLADQAAAEAVGREIRGSARVLYTESQPVEVSEVAVSGAGYSLLGNAVIEDLASGFSTFLDATLEAQDLSRFSGLAGQELDGGVKLALKGQVTPLSGAFDLTASGQTLDLKVGNVQADAVLQGLTQVTVTANRDETGTYLRDLALENAALSLTGMGQLHSRNSRVRAKARFADVALVAPQYTGPITVDATAIQDASGWSIDAVTVGPYGAALTAKGLATGKNARLDFTADVPDMASFVADVRGPLKARGNVQQTSNGWRIQTSANGPYRIKASVDGLVTPSVDVVFELSAPDLQPLVPQLRGPLQAQGNLKQTDKGFLIKTSARGPYGATGRVEGVATGPEMALSFDLNLPNVAPLLPSVSGPFSASGVLRQLSKGIAINTKARGPYASRGSLDGVITGPSAAVDFDVHLPDIGQVVDKVNGPLSVLGNARKLGAAWQLTTAADGPAGTQVQVDGLVNTGGALDLDISGSAPLGLSRPFIAPRNLQGQAQFDLSIDGPAALSSLSGTVQTRNATLSAPNLRVALDNIAATVRLGRNRADVELQANAVNGGQLRVGGGVILTPSLPADFQISLQDLVLSDPRLYRTSVNGALRLAGPVSGGAQISGQIEVGETTVNVPSTGLTSFGEIPQITHLGDRADVKATRRKAGLLGDTSGGDPSATAGPGFGLNLNVRAPRRIFVRGRGLDAELGGGLRLTGTTNQIISAGRFDLLRGRLDILGKRFDLTEGAIQFQGDLVPYLRFVSTTSTKAGQVSVVVEGPADAPEVTFTSSPPAPQDEVLAELLFGRKISDISAFQALQLANAVATLAGRGGGGIISNLRDGFGLDDLDVTTSDSGATEVRVGKYLSEKVYTDAAAASDGTGEVSLNIDITPNLKGKAVLGSDGNTGIGLFFEKDY